MFEVGTGTIFAAIIVLIVLVFLGALASSVTAAMMFGFNNFVKTYSNDIRRLEDKYSHTSTKLHNAIVKVEQFEAALKQCNYRVQVLFSMMKDASDMNLSSEEISRRIRLKLDKNGDFDVAAKKRSADDRDGKTA